MLVVDDHRKVVPAMNTEDPPERASSGPRVLARTSGQPEQFCLNDIKLRRAPVDGTQRLMLQYNLPR